MRDKNLTLAKFNIQLEKSINLKLQDDRLLRTAVTNSPKCLMDTDEFQVTYPRDYRGLRAISILLWSLPEELQWRIRMDLTEKQHSQLNSKQRIEISLLLESKEICYFYLYKTSRYTARELFGNILGNEMKVALRQLRIKRKKLKKPVRVERHRGYRDKGSLRPYHLWLERFDYSFTEYQNANERKSDLLFKTTTRLKQLLTEKLLHSLSGLSDEKEHSDSPHR